MSKVFISYSHEDEKATTALQTFLNAKLPVGSEVFVSGERLQFGDDWLQKIRHALKSAKIVIALFSPESIKRPWVNFEAGAAWLSDTKTLIPVCIGGLIPTRLPTPYSNLQGFDLCGDRDSIRDFVAGLSKILAPALPMRSFQRRDEDVKALYEGLESWRSARRARARVRSAYKRRTGRDIDAEIEAELDS